MSRVLVVDDREENLLLLRTLFEAHGWDVDEACHGAEALARAVAEPPALVVSDLLMPVMDGYTLLRHWKADERLRRIPFVVHASTYMDTKGEQLALDLGADAFIPKPFEAELFMGRILEIMDRDVIGEGTTPREPMPEGLLEGYSEVLAHKLEEKMAELQRAESQIEAREAHLRAIYDADPECVKVLSADGSLLEMNAAGLRMVEADSFEQVANKSVYPMIVEEDRAAFRSLSERVFAGESGVLEFRIVGLKGGARWLKTSAAPLRNLSGKITGLLGITRDITSHKQAEETLAIRARQQAIVAALGRMALAGTDLRTLFDQAVVSVAEIFAVEYCEVLELMPDGSSLKFVCGVGWDSSVVDQTSTEIEPGSLAGFTLRSGEPVIVEDLRNDERFSGPKILRDHAVISGLSVIIGSVESSFGVMGAHTAERRAFTQDDVNFFQSVANVLAEAIRSRRSGRMLREANERLQFAISAGGIGLWDWDLTTDTPKYSREWKRQIGYDENEIRDGVTEWQSRIHPDDLERTLQIEQDYLSGVRADYESHFRFRHKDGSWRHILARASALRNPDGKPIRLVGSHVDVTEYMELQARFLHVQKFEGMGRLAGGVAHDFNNLLTVIKGFAALTLKGLKEGDPLRENLDEISRAGDRAAALTRQLLAFSRQQIMKPEVLNLGTVAANLENLLRRLIGEDIDLVIDTAPDLDSVRADSGQIEQVIVNLVINARDAMPGGGRLTIETSNVDLDAFHAAQYETVVPGPHVMLVISDTGVGMDAATRARIFEPFFTTKDTGKGTGLGLATAYGIVKQSGGSIWAYSELGMGATFKIYLPRVDTDVKPPRSTGPVKVARGTETILVAEDEDALRNLVVRLLQGDGYTVVAVSNGVEALALLEQYDGEVDLLLTDIVMPQMGGPELAKQLLQIRPGTKVLCMSGYTDDAILRQSILDASTHFIGKPYTAEDLTRKIREVLDS